MVYSRKWTIGHTRTDVTCFFLCLASYSRLAMRCHLVASSVVVRPHDAAAATYINTSKCVRMHVALVL
jgi:hypothetical protein